MCSPVMCAQTCIPLLNVPILQINMVGFLSHCLSLDWLNLYPPPGLWQCLEEHYAPTCKGLPASIKNKGCPKKVKSNVRHHKVWKLLLC